MIRPRLGGISDEFAVGIGKEYNSAELEYTAGSAARVVPLAGVRHPAGSSL